MATLAATSQNLMSSSATAILCNAPPLCRTLALKTSSSSSSSNNNIIVSACSNIVRSSSRIRRGLITSSEEQIAAVNSCVSQSRSIFLSSGSFCKSKSDLESLSLRRAEGEPRFASSLNPGQGAGGALNWSRFGAQRDLKGDFPRRGLPVAVMGSKTMTTSPNGTEKKSEPKVYPMYLANKAVKSSSGKFLDVVNKYTGEVDAKVPLASPEDLENAIQAAVKTFPETAALPAFDRKAVLVKVVAELKKRSEEIAKIITLESGKAIKDSRLEVIRSIETFEVAAEETTRIYGEHMNLDITPRNKGIQGIVRKFPIGPISMVSPWNFPLNLVAHKVAPAIAVGCTWVLKPSTRTPLSALILGEILETCEELPKGSFSILPVSRSEADVFTVDERFKLLTFTGSGVAGWDMKARAGKKKVVMELGGNAPCVVEDLVPDLNGTLARLMIGAYYQGGQSCIHMQRLYVREGLYDEVKNALLDAVSKLKVGDPFLDETNMGPMISETAAKGVEEWINEAVEKGGKCLIGGKRNGAFVEPTVLENVPHDAQARKEEIFGPVLLLYSYKDFKEAIAEANNTHYGLQAGVFTSDLNKAFYAFEKMEVGGVLLNDSPSWRVDSQPYGGVKDSGVQREGVKYAMDDMLEPKVLVMRNPGVF